MNNHFDMHHEHEHEHGGHRRGPGRRGPGRGPERGGRRRNRGDVRTAVLVLLSEEPMHGYQLMQTISERTNGNWAPSPGAIYPTLNQLEDEGLVTVTAEGGRKLVSLTEAGQAHVSEHSPNWSDPFPTGESDGVNLREHLHGLMEATRVVGRTGTQEQRTAAAEILRQARSSIFQLLADE